MQEPQHRAVEQTREKILNAASQNSELLHQLSKSEEAPGLFDAHQKVVESTRKELAEQETTVRHLKQATEEQFTAHRKLRDSRFRRTYYRVTRMLEKFDAKAMKEEREYFNSLAEQSKAEGRRESLASDLEEAEAALVPLEKLARAHGEIHLKIDALYDKLFAGPTPGFPREDERERDFHTANGENDGTKQSIYGARHARKLLNQASISITRADNYSRYALQDASTSFFFFDEAIGLLRYSETNVRNALTAVEKASEYLGVPTPEMEVANMILKDALRAANSNAWVSRDGSAITDSINELRAKLEEAQNRVKSLSDQTKAREAEQLKELQTTARVLEEARQGLEEVRQGIFEEVAGFGEAPPAYNYCCDRTEFHCAIPPPGVEDEDILNQPQGPTPEEVSAQAAQQSRQHNPHQDVAQKAPAPTHEEVQESRRSVDQDTLISPIEGESARGRTGEAMNSLGPELQSYPPPPGRPGEE